MSAGAGGYALTERSFRTSVEQGKAGRARIVLPFDPGEAWGQKSRHHVTGSVNGIKIRGPLEQEDGRFVLRLGPAWRRDSGVSAGDDVEVVLRAEGPQVASMPADFAAALAAEPAARSFFEGLATFYRKGYMRWIEDAKRPETRAARLREAVELLKAGRRQR